MTIDPAVAEVPQPAASRFRTTGELAHLVGQGVACSDWLQIVQPMIDSFAETTRDWQWIHIDRERAARESPQGDTIAHGFLLAALLVPMFTDAVRIEEQAVEINYGFDRLRFTAPVTTNSKVRGRFVLKDYQPIEGGVQLTWNVTVERQGHEKPAMVADWLIRRYS